MDKDRLSPEEVYKLAQRIEDWSGPNNFAFGRIGNITVEMQPYEENGKVYAVDFKVTSSLNTLDLGYARVFDDKKYEGNDGGVMRIIDPKIGEFFTNIKRTCTERHQRELVDSRERGVAEARKLLENIVAT
jgi:hypothetical protein